MFSSVNNMCRPAVNNWCMPTTWDRITDLLTRRGKSWAWLGREIEVSDQDIHNWKIRGVPTSRYEAIAESLNVKVDDLLRDRWTSSQYAPEGVIVHPVAQESSHPKFEDVPTTIAWEHILSRPLQREFQTVMPDASMEPDVPRGARIICITGVDPLPGDWALVADAHGHLYLREIRQLRPGLWQAHARNPAFLALDSERDALRVVAIFDGMRGRKSRD